MNLREFFKKRVSKKTGKRVFLIGLILLFFLFGTFLGFNFQNYIKKIIEIPFYFQELGKKVLNYSIELPLPKFLLKLFKISSGFEPSIPEKISENKFYKKQTDKPLSFCPPCSLQESQEELIIKVVKKVSPAVVSIVVSKDVTILREYYEDPFREFREFFGDDFFFEFKTPRYKPEGKRKEEISGGTGFIISEDGLILTNKHVVLEKDADYKVITGDGNRYEAQILAHDPFQDLAIIKIKTEKKLPILKLGDSSKIQIGQTVIAIGNALGEFRNTVSVGVVSGLGRTITAFGGGVIETLEDIIQTDAAINRGNSGGPLLNLKGEVIGINVAIAERAQGIGFAIPSEKAQRAIKQVKKTGKIVYPFLGIKYVLITPEIQEEKKLSIREGALIIGENDLESAILPNSAAEKAGLQEGDIILEINNQKVTLKNSLAKLIQKHEPGDTLKLKVLRKDKILELTVVLQEKSS